MAKSGVYIGARRRGPATAGPGAGSRAAPPGGGPAAGAGRPFPGAGGNGGSGQAGLPPAGGGGTGAGVGIGAGAGRAGFAAGGRYASGQAARPAAPQRRAGERGAGPRGAGSQAAASRSPAPPAESVPARPPGRLRGGFSRHRRVLLAAAVLLAGIGLALFLGRPPQGPAPQMSQKEFDRALARGLETVKLPATAARAWEVIRPSVVQVRGFGDAPARKAAPQGRGEKGKEGTAPGRERTPPPDEDGDETAQGTGTGVVIVDDGLILTNLHVVAGAHRIQVIFDGGLESEAVVVSTQPENDLAVLKARTLPDDLVPATLRSTGDLMPGDRVVAVGFPFGIGPSVSAGVISGMGREYRSESGDRALVNLIQFDAAANPGNSGGPLVTDEGEVVGIVTGILNPVGQRFFVGIGFAVPIENAVSGLGLPPF